MGKAQREKGKRFERWVVKWLAPVCPKLFRSANQAGGANMSDVEVSPYWIEAKHDNRISVWALLAQAQKDREAVNDSRPILGVLKHDRKEPIVVMLAGEFLDMLRGKDE